MHRIVHYETEHGTLGEGYVADMHNSPHAGKPRLRVVDFIREIADPDSGIWLDSSKCFEPPEPGPQTLSSFV